jgi:hypothetical protein
MNINLWFEAYRIQAVGENLESWIPPPRLSALEMICGRRGSQICQDFTEFVRNAFVADNPRSCLLRVGLPVVAVGIGNSHAWAFPHGKYPGDLQLIAAP